MEVGSFFEIYVVNDNEKRGRIYEVADITNLSVSRNAVKQNLFQSKILLWQVFLFFN